MTPDTSGAHAFYAKVVGWKTQAFEHDPSYQMFAAGSGPLGGSVAQASGTPHWLHYVGTPDIEATVQAAKSRGASVTKEITSIPNGGKYAVLADPQGAAIAVYQSSARMPARSRRRSAANSPGTSWPPATGAQRSTSTRQSSAGRRWPSTTWAPRWASTCSSAATACSAAACSTSRPQMPGGPGWLGYVRVKDVNDAVKKAKGARGTLVNGPMEVPGGDWIAQFVDPYGAMFAVHTLAADLKPAAASSCRGTGCASRAARPSRPSPRRRRRKQLPRRRHPRRRRPRRRRLPRRKRPRRRKRRPRARSARPARLRRRRPAARRPRSARAARRKPPRRRARVSRRHAIPGAVLAGSRRLSFR